MAGTDHGAGALATSRRKRSSCPRDGLMQRTVTVSDARLPAWVVQIAVNKRRRGNLPRPERFDQGATHRSGHSRATSRICADSHLVEPVPGCAEITHPPGELRSVYRQVRGIHGTRGGQPYRPLAERSRTRRNTGT